MSSWDRFNLRMVRMSLGFLAPLAFGPSLAQAQAKPTRPPVSRPAGSPSTRPAVSTAAAPALPPTTLPAGYRFAQSADGRLRFACPPDWQPVPPEQLPAGIVAMAVAKELAGTSVHVSINALSGQTSLNPTVARTINALKRGVKEFKLVESVPATLAGQPGHRIVYDGRNENGPFRSAQLIAIHGAKMFGVTFRASPEQHEASRAAAERMIASLQAADLGAGGATTWAAGEPIAFGGKGVGFTLQYPPTWTRAKPTSPKMAFMAVAGVAEPADASVADQVTIAIYALGGAGGTPQALAADVVKGMSAATPTLKVIEESDEKVGGLDARRVTFAGPSAGRELKIQSVVVVRGNYGYGFTCTADASDFEKVQAEFQKVLGTVAWLSL